MNNRSFALQDGYQCQYSISVAVLNFKQDYCLSKRKVKHGQLLCLLKCVIFVNPKEDEIAIVQDTVFAVYICQDIIIIFPHEMGNTR